ncbi:Endothelin-1 [Bagarius yarrelli]|uniref:Endothelin-1 n=1 Tax=Bagarius yarrelli TaxID=175774 RepID=A0A556TZP1_BAGYA|nr:Endothelin-1 [Bagarius yarrelli]
MDFFSILFLTAILMLEQKASTVSMSPAPTGSPSQFSSRSPHREKRCSCENLKDRECMYFCHIGIVWVNTPSQVIPYGVGFHQMRPRRQVERCFCTYTRDPVCVTFCSLRYIKTHVCIYIYLHCV